MINYVLIERQQIITSLSFATCNIPYMAVDAISALSICGLNSSQTKLQVISRHLTGCRLSRNHPLCLYESYSPTRQTAILYNLEFYFIAPRRSNY